MKKLLIGVVLLAVMAIGCVPQAKYNKLETFLTQVQESNSQLAQRNTQLEESLAEFQKTCPPHDFASKMELQTWANAHIQPVTQYAVDGFLSAVRVRDEALIDGYLVYPAVIPNDASTLYTVGCQAFAGNDFYIWNPERSPVSLILLQGFSK